MNVNKISKIFVEQDEEIVFVIENILNATSDRVILVLPNVSALTSSVVSLRILSKQIVKSIKQVVLVCDNGNARHLCSKANLAVRSKISEVDKEAWMESKELKVKLLDENEKIKKELLGARTPDSESSGISEGPVTAKLIDEEPAVEDEIEPIITRQRMKGKVIDVNGIKLFSGADITDAPDLLDLERRRLNDEEITEEEEEYVEREAEGDLVGTDINYSKRNKVKLPRTKFKFKMPLFMTKLANSGWGPKLIGIGVLVFFLYAIFAYFFTSDVGFTIYQESRTVQIKKTIIADSAAQQIIPDKLTITAEIFTKSGTVNGSAEPTGIGKTGESATGQVTIFNLTAASVTLPVGTALTEQKTGRSLKFLTTAEVTIPALIDTTPGTASVAVKAETFGEAYNMTGTVTYKIGTFDINTQMNGKSFIDFTAGTTEDTIIVSKEDIEALKATLSDQLKLDLSTQVKALLADDDILLVGSEKYTDETYTCTAKEGDALGEPTDGVLPKFTGELKLTITALVISRADLRTIAESVIRQENSTDNQEIAVTLNDPIMENVRVEGTKATFDLRAVAKVIGVLDADKLKTLIMGKSVDEAKLILGRFQGVTDVRSRYNPPFIPYSIQNVSDDPQRVTIILAEQE